MFVDLEISIFHRNQFKLCTYHQVTGFLLKNHFWATYDTLDTGSYSWRVVLTFYHFLFCAWIVETLKILRKSLKLSTNDWITLCWLSSTHLSSLRGSSWFNLYSFVRPSLWYLCWFEKWPYCIEISSNFASITHSLFIRFLLKN